LYNPNPKIKIKKTHKPQLEFNPYEQHVQVKSGNVYELIVQKNKFKTKDFDLIAKRTGENLEVLLADDTSVIFDNYFEVCADCTYN
jgi:hypothetical protein